jgi:hypothetical protein
MNVYIWQSAGDAHPLLALIESLPSRQAKSQTRTLGAAYIAAAPSSL